MLIVIFIKYCINVGSLDPCAIFRHQATHSVNYLFICHCSNIRLADPKRLVFHIIIILHLAGLLNSMTHILMVNSITGLQVIFEFFCFIGLSNFNSKQVDDIIEKSRVKPAVLQVECHPYLNQADLLAHCRKRDVVGKFLL